MSRSMVCPYYGVGEKKFHHVRPRKDFLELRL